MPFLNPFKKNNRSEGVKLTGMTSDADPRDTASSSASERREPSFGGSGHSEGGFSKGANNAPAEPTFESAPEPVLTSAFKAAAPSFESVKPTNVSSMASSEVPPAFTFSEPKAPTQPKSWGSEAPKLQEPPTFGSAKSTSNVASPLSATSTPSTPASAPWDPYGMGSPVKPSAAENPFSAVPPSPVGIGGVAPEKPQEPVLPQALNVMADAAEPVTVEPTQPAGATPAPSVSPVLPGSPSAEGAKPATSPETAATTPTGPMEPVMTPMERPAKAQAPQEKAEKTASTEAQAASSTKSFFQKFGRSATPARSMSPAEREARTRSRHRYVGAAALLMALVVAAPFMLDKSEEIDNRPFADERMDIPRETETSTAINPVPLDKKPISGDVDVADMTLGKSSSTAKANLAREADLPTKPSRVTKPAPEKTATPPKKEAPAANAQKTEAPAKTAGITPPTGSGWYVQVLATGNEEGAERVVRRMTALGLSAYRIKEGGNLWKVRAGLYGTKKEAENAQATIILNNVAQKPYVRKQ